MPIVRIPDPNALPTIQNDYVRQNNLIATGFLQVNKPIWESGGNIVQGAIFQIGGTVYHCTAATAIGGGASNYIKLTPSGDGSTLAPTYVADLTGVTWNSTYNGYYDVSGNAYVFDELAAILATEIAGANTRLWKALITMLTQNVTFSGDPTFSGNATFDNDIIANGGIRTDGANTLKIKILDIGAWNMNVSIAGAAIVTIAHGLTLANIRSITVIIRDDSDSLYMDYASQKDNSNFQHLVASGANIIIRVAAGDFWDHADFNGGANRGWIKITYIG